MEHWPEVKREPEYQQLIRETFAKYKNKERLQYKRYLQSYHSLGDYLNWGEWKVYKESRTLKFDDKGIPTIKYGERFYYNPVTIAQYALKSHGLLIKGKISSELFFHSVDKLLELQAPNGAFLYPFAFSYHIQPLQPGWVSGMAQGQVLSVFARAFHLKKDRRYLHAGNQALSFLVIPITKGGTKDTLAHLDPSLKQYLFFEEYPLSPPTYTLNGFQFTLLGLYDWWKVTQSANPHHAQIAGEQFKNGMKTLKGLMKYYDIGGYTTYDLSHIIYRKEPKIAGYYHPIHIYLLHALYSITKDEECNLTMKRWISYLESPLS